MKVAQHTLSAWKAQIQEISQTIERLRLSLTDGNKNHADCQSAAVLNMSLHLSQAMTQAENTAEAQLFWEAPPQLSDTPANRRLLRVLGELREASRAVQAERGYSNEEYIKMADHWYDRVSKEVFNTPPVAAYITEKRRETPKVYDTIADRAI